jgi:SAM-dependent methyltransferase
MYLGRDLMFVDWPEWYHEEALRRLPTSGRWIDVGCGTGTFVNAARQRGVDAIGVDFSEEAIAAGKRRFGLDKLYCLSVEETTARFGRHQFDVATAFEVLEHMDDVSAFVGSLEDLVRPGGHIVISVPNRERFPRILGEGDVPPHHFTRWSAQALAGLLVRRGLDDVSVRVCPRRIGLQNLLMYNLRTGLMVRSLRRAELGDRVKEREILQSRSRSAAIVKRKLSAAGSFVLAPLLPFLRGPLMLAIARTPARR